ncbi:hypothetical protein ODJ79_42545 [Actinoplanes sp. KI2]|uniref:hypothetical protein n=1 Tax=Actinoplanes sp. KI2 TaxID=2983315 RepID=UPI0021D5A4CE|nr:hypothetical protein [Actinoplanes sp. KI2]MCU7730439.1 hypothetical protein [Actinoplanes sp. KI2]
MTSSPIVPDDEVARLRDEVATLQARLQDRRRRQFALLALRRVAAAVFIMITAFALVTSVVGVWAATTVLSTDRWVSTVAPLPKDPKIAAAVAEYSTDQLFTAINVQQRIADVLPPQAAFIAGPVTGQLRTQIQNTVYKVMQSDQFQRIWVGVNARVHARVLDIIEGKSQTVTAQQDKVEIDLLPLINQVIRALSDQLPTLFGKTITLPDLSSGEIPDNLRARVQDALGVTLPENFAQFTVYDNGQLYAVQQSVEAAKRYLVLFVTATILLLLIALAISPWRRRTLLQLGLWLVVAAVAVTAVLRGVRDQLLNQVPDGVYREGVAAAVTSVFSLLRTRGTQLIWIGAILAVVCYLFGPGRGATWLRAQVRRGAVITGRATARGARWLGGNAPGWTAAHRDVLRVGGLVVGGILALLLSSWTSLLVILIVVAAYELAVTLIGRTDRLPDGSLSESDGSLPESDAPEPADPAPLTPSHS